MFVIASRRRLAPVFFAAALISGHASAQETDASEAAAAEADPIVAGIDYSGTGLLLDEIHSGALHSDHPMMSDGTHADCFQFEATEGESYSFTLRSSDFDSYLLIGVGYCQDVLLQHENDDFEDDTTDSQIVLTATYPFYSVYVNTFEPAATGDYTLHVEQVDSAAAEAAE
ncbi:MAG: hypothetical protein CMQ37_14805 [Gammaproteobacteria bacterium]|nr:hypothetical protein [Gammaproteobacteria bacterium]|tara:strand:- start:1816 stop:2328 length:513 start_codon:yes stop_codon:yes gene_type:complete